MMLINFLKLFVNLNNVFSFLDLFKFLIIFINFLIYLEFILHKSRIHYYTFKDIFKKNLFCFIIIDYFILIRVKFKK